MVAIAQLVEHRVVVAGAAGSSPVSHPDGNVGASCTRCPDIFLVWAGWGTQYLQCRPPHLQRESQKTLLWHCRLRFVVHFQGGVPRLR